MTTDTQRWTVGNAVISSVVEDEIAHIPPEFLFPAATASAVRSHPWVLADYADPDGNITLRVQALIVEHAGRTVLVDPCVGNFKTSELPFWNQQEWSFMDRFVAAGFSPDAIDTVVHTHLHADHIGWDTRPEAGEWVPTFPSARHLYTAAEMDLAQSAPDDPSYRESILPIVAAGLADIVSDDADLGAGLRLEPTPGHTPGHVSLWLESDGERAFLAGDILHHPVQCAEPTWAEIGDVDADLARTHRRRMLSAAAESGVLFIAAHFPNRPAGRVQVDGDVWRFVPEPGEP